MMEKPLSKFEKLMLLNAYPVKFILNLIGGAIALYFLWKHRPVNALLLGGAFIFSGTLLSVKSKTRSEDIAKTIIGKAFLSYSTKWGFACYCTSHILIPVSAWFHNIYLILAGILILGLGLLKVKKTKTFSSER